jgi:hypothetical protein
VSHAGGLGYKPVLLLLRFECGFECGKQLHEFQGQVVNAQLMEYSMHSGALGACVAL